MNHKIICGKSEEVLKDYPDNTFDSCVTDAPYEISFFSSSWDKYGIAFDVDFWSEVYRVMKPGAHILVFGGTRTYHRMTCAVEDAGFEIRDSIVWIYASGFPKSMSIALQLDKMDGKIGQRGKGGFNVAGIGEGNNRHAELHKKGKGDSMPGYTAAKTKAAKQWNGWHTALKPAHESIVLVRKPISEKNIAANVLKWGAGGLNIKNTRVSLYSHELYDMMEEYQDALQRCRKTQGGKEKK